MDPFHREHVPRAQPLVGYGGEHDVVRREAARAEVGGDLAQVGSLLTKVELRRVARTQRTHLSTTHRAAQRQSSHPKLGHARALLCGEVLAAGAVCAAVHGVRGGMGREG